ncbi:hypothetical protein [Streptomyces pseudogriseolus]|uniref:hypothetical protein n=1 Tax=Streptomyces pseudogriseolus TaxID=36817 RepID=UPI003FA228FF
MPENEETTEQVESAPSETDAAPEAAVSEEEPFDRARAEEKIRKANSEAKNLRERLKELEPLAQKARELEDAQKSEQERLTEQLTQAQERIRTVQQRAVRAEVRALAAAEFADPEDAHAFLSLDSYIDDNGEIDAAAIQQDLKELLKRKPHLARSSGDISPRPPRPDRSQGSSGNGSRTPTRPEDEFAGWLGNVLGKTS